MTKNLDEFTESFIKSGNHIKRATEIEKKAKNRSHFGKIYQDILQHIKTYILAITKKDNGSREDLQELKRSEKSLSDYLDLIDKNDNYRNGEFTKESYLPKFKGGAEDYVRYSLNVLEGKLN